MKIHIKSTSNPDEVAKYLKITTILERSGVFMSQSKRQIRLIRWTENPHRGSNCSLRVYMSEPNLKEVNGGGGGGGGRVVLEGEGRAS